MPKTTPTTALRRKVTISDIVEGAQCLFMALVFLAILGWVGMVLLGTMALIVLETIFGNQIQNSSTIMVSTFVLTIAAIVAWTVRDELALRKRQAAWKTHASFEKDTDGAEHYYPSYYAPVPRPKGRRQTPMESVREMFH